MSTYVMSDIHGQYDTFLRMLKKIHFSDNDVLYILGDVIDRGRDGLKVLEYVMKSKNIHLLLGNHEFMMLKYFKTKAWRYYDLWMKNGGSPTLQAFDNISNNEKIEYISYIKSLPPCLVIEINDEKYFLVHAGVHPSVDFNDLLEAMKLGEKELSWFLEDLLWIRHEFLSFENNVPFNVIFGHTPIPHIPYYAKNLDEELVEKSKRSEIISWDNKIAIDCGCAGAVKLGCLRLDDMKEYYISCK